MIRLQSGDGGSCGFIVCTQVVIQALLKKLPWHAALGTSQTDTRVCALPHVCWGRNMGAVFGWMQWERFAKARGGFDMAGGGRERQFHKGLEEDHMLHGRRVSCGSELSVVHFSTG